MERSKMLGAAIAAAMFVAIGGGARAQEYSARLNGFNVTGGLGAGETGAILTNGTGTFQLELDKKSSTATYTLTFSDLTSPVIMAHIHFGKVHVAGGIMVWLCQTTTKPSPVADTPFCPTSGGTVSGTITAGDVVAVPGQNITAGDFDALTDALASKTAYANVHTVNFPAGEIRGQVRQQRKDHDHDEDHGDGNHD